MTVDEIISAAGGVGKLARLLGVSHSSVCDWRRGGRVPVERALAINKALSIPLGEIRPDIWVGDELHAANESLRRAAASRDPKAA